MLDAPTAQGSTTTSGALSRFKVLDLTRVRSGPTCVRQLADWGAQVVKIEMPEGLDQGDPMGGPRGGPDFQNLHRNKRGLTLNLKSPEGVAILKKLAAEADVVVENFRPDVKDRLGIGYEALAAVNPRLVYASISGFGQDGPYAGRPGFDQIAQGMGGLMSITGLPGQGPVRVGIPIADLCAGLFAAQGIMIALLEREVSGKGQWVQTSLLQAQAFMLDFQAARWLQAGEVPKQAGNNHPTSIPTGVFRTSDGFINIAATGNAIWKRFCVAAGAPEWLEDPRFGDSAGRSEHRDALNALIDTKIAGRTSDGFINIAATGNAIWKRFCVAAGAPEWLEDARFGDSAGRSEHRDALNALIDTKIAGRTSADWVEALNEAGVPAGPIYDIGEMFGDPQVKHLGIATTLDDGAKSQTYVAQPMTLSRTPSRIVSHPPAIGADTAAVLAEAGIPEDEIAGLKSRQVV